MFPVYAYWQAFIFITVLGNGTCYLLSLATYQYFPYALLPGALFVLAVHILRVPRPQASRAEKILGKDLHLVDNTADNNNVLMRTVAHRGAGLDAPENSLIAFKQCANEGCNFIEFDVALSKDGVPVVFHDSTLERLVTHDKRSVSNVDYSELARIDISASHPFSERYVGTCIPTLDMTVKQLLADGQKMFIDVKEWNQRMIQVILNLFETYPSLYENAVVTTFFPTLIYGIRKRNPNIVCAMAYRPYFFSHCSYSFMSGVGPRRFDAVWKHYIACLVDTVHSWALPRITYYFIGLSVILLHKDSVSPQIIKEWRDREVRPCIWTINKPTDKQYVTRTLKCTYLTDTLIGEKTLLNHVDSLKMI